MVYFISASLFLLGLAIGSFLNCVIYRLSEAKPRPLSYSDYGLGQTREKISYLLPQNTYRQHRGRGSRHARSFLIGHSYCPRCKHILNWQDLIPILSFIILKGKCRYCHKSISLQYPLVELSTGFLFLLIFQNLHENLQGFNPCYLLYLLVITCFLIIIFVYDLKHYLIPDKIVYPAIALTFFFFLGFELFAKKSAIADFLPNLYSGLGAALFFFLIWFFSRGKWLGFGDVKLVFLMGLFLGFPGILTALFLAFFIGAIIGIGLIITGKKQLSSQVPFGPFLVSGTFLALFFGDNLIGWYFNLL